MLCLMFYNLNFPRLLKCLVVPSAFDEWVSGGIVMTSKVL